MPVPCRVSLNSDLRTFFKANLPDNLDELAMVTEVLKEELPEVNKLATLALTIPVTAVPCERSFSGLKRLKTRLRSTMGDKRLSDLSVIAFERGIVDGLKPGDIIDRFAAKKNRRIDLVYRK